MHQPTKMAPTIRAASGYGESRSRSEVKTTIGSRQYPNMLAVLLEDMPSSDMQLRSRCINSQAVKEIP